MMNIKIKKLSKELISDYIHFFENIAFSDHKEWSYCYCCGFHIDDTEIQRIHKEKELNGTLEEGLKNEAISFINENILQGYLVYEKNNVIGWCNCNNKLNYKRLYTRNELWDENEKNIKIKTIVCFMIAPDMRGKGIASEILNQICLDAIEEGFSCIEAYPTKNNGNNFEHYPGPYRLYEKSGFKIHKIFEKDMIVRKYLE